MRSGRGFTLIELMVVVAVISIAAEVAVPHFISVRNAVNERNARFDLVTIFRAQRDFRELDLDGDGIANYARSLEELSAASEIDVTLATGETHGYRFRMRILDPLVSWRADARPVAPCVTGDTAMTIDQTGTITEAAAEGPDCRRDEVGKDSDRAIERLQTVAKADVAGALDRLRKDNPNLTGIVLAAMDRNHDGEVTIDEVLQGDYLALAKTIKGKLVFPKEWDAGEAGKDEKVVKIVDKLVEELEKHLKLGIGGEGDPPPLREPQDQVPAP